MAPELGLGNSVSAEPVSTLILRNTYSVSFDGTNDYVDLGTDSSLKLGRAMTVCGWANIDSHSGENPIIGATKSSGMDSLYYLGTRTKGSDKVWMFWREDEDGTDYTADSSAVTATGEWTHVVGTDDGTNIKLYVNGALIDTVSASGLTVPDTLNSVYIGRSHEGFGGINPYFDGYIDEVAIFNSALSASQVSSIYNGGEPQSLASYNPVGWWRMGDNDGGTGSTITDQGSGGNNGTLTNGPVFSTVTP